MAGVARIQLCVLRGGVHVNSGTDCGGSRRTQTPAYASRAITRCHASILIPTIFAGWPTSNVTAGLRWLPKDTEYASRTATKRHESTLIPTIFAGWPTSNVTAGLRWLPKDTEYASRTTTKRHESTLISKLFPGWAMSDVTVKHWTPSKRRRSRAPAQDSRLFRRLRVVLRTLAATRARLHHTVHGDEIELVERHGSLPSRLLGCDTGMK
ncbi:hypothetical protein K490DRAFT_54368 [Saccharata proteae CBS 121410]|uniref:Uncharacterized protein n=1 Tax=Saccharata proteae CBS 121410 TaxID=1314787 RepID=A0A9P4HZF4_9PEZI|nr:hypothetical protein K490DRAFT_54368 [Saccharata proteae CBS 121410]